MLFKRHTTHKDSLISWIVCIAGALFFFYDFIQLMMCNTLSLSLIQDFRIDARQLSYLSSIFLLANTLLLFPAGILVNRYTTRRIVISMLALSVVGAAGFAFTHDFLLACIFRGMTGIAHAFCFLCCTSLVSRWFSMRHQAFVMGLVVTIAMLGGTVAQKPLSLLTKHIGWRAALQFNAALGALILLFVVLVVQDYPSTTAAENLKHQTAYETMGFLTSLKRALRNAQTWYYGLYTALLNLPIMILGALFGNMFLTSVYGLSDTQAPSVCSMLYVGTLVGSPLMGKISDGWGSRKRPMWIGAIFSLVLLALVVYNNHFTASTLACLFFLLGLTSSTQVLSYPCIGALNDKALAGTSMGLAATIIMGIGGASQPITGHLLNMHQQGIAISSGTVPYNATDFVFAFSLMVGGMVVAMLALACAKAPEPAA